jgi:hypothetical protein
MERGVSLDVNLAADGPLEIAQDTLFLALQ